jgi:hypothetical protein
LNEGAHLQAAWFPKQTKYRSVTVEALLVETGMKSCTLLFLPASLLFMIGLVACFPRETIESTYENIDQAVTAGAVERGWVPEWLPDAAVNLHEKHDLDRNASILRFSVSLTDFAIPLDCQETTDPPSATLTADWWPAGLHRTHRTFSCAGSYLATDKENGYVYLWHP